jgi:hypothetical protein
MQQKQLSTHEKEQCKDLEKIQKEQERRSLVGVQMSLKRGED